MSVGKRVAALGMAALLMLPAQGVFAQDESVRLLSQNITQQLKPYWAPPAGQDYDLLVTVLSWDLNPDGSIIGNPRILYQSGVNDKNIVIARKHAEAAIRAVKSASPFNLPLDQYGKWRRIRAYHFDSRISDH